VPLRTDDESMREASPRRPPGPLAGGPSQAVEQAAVTTRTTAGRVVLGDLLRPDHALDRMPIAARPRLRSTDPIRKKPRVRRPAWLRSPRGFLRIGSYSLGRGDQRHQRAEATRSAGCATPSGLIVARRRLGCWPEAPMRCACLMRGGLVDPTHACDDRARPNKPLQPASPKRLAAERQRR
jgi:hypothetical protein